MLQVTVIEKKCLQDILNAAAEKLQTATENFFYRNIYGISIFQLLPVNNAFDLGISKEAYSLGPTGNYAQTLITFLTGTAAHKDRIATLGVNTDASQVKLTKIAQHHNFWYPHICKKIASILSGNLEDVNAIVYPIAKHTFKDNAYKPCSTYVQYQMHQSTNTLSITVNYRSQHLYMLAFNIQFWAFQLLQICNKFNLTLGSVFLNCTNHHMHINQK